MTGLKRQVANLKRELEKEGVVLDEKSYEQLDLFADSLLEWNKVHNLTGAKTKEEVERNILDSLYPKAFLPPFKTAVDIGTGAGFPGLMLAIAYKQAQFVLVEPRAKRAAFLSFVKTALGLNNVRVENRRIEEIVPFKVDLITSRAVADTNTLIKLCRPFVGSKTLLLFYKGKEVLGEIDKEMEYKIIKREKRHYLLIKRIKSDH